MDKKNIEQLDALLYQFAFSQAFVSYLFDEEKGAEAFLNFKKEMLNNSVFILEVFHKFLSFMTKVSVNQIDKERYSFLSVKYQVKAFEDEIDFENFISTIEFRIEDIEKSEQLSTVKMLIVVVKEARPKHFYALVHDTLFDNYVLRRVNKDAVSFAVNTFGEFKPFDVMDFIIDKHFPNLD